MKTQERFERLASLHDHFTNMVKNGRSVARGDPEGATFPPAPGVTALGKAYHEGFTEGVMAALRLALGVAYGDQDEAAFALEQFPDLDT